MSAQAKPFSTPGRNSQEYGRISLLAAENGQKEMEASCLEVLIRVMGHTAAGFTGGEAQTSERFEEDTTTMLLFPRGAVIRLSAPVVRGQELMLINKRTNRYVHCRVSNLRTTPDSNYAEIEFTHSVADFWGIAPSRDAANVAFMLASLAPSFPAEPGTRTESPIPAAPRALAAAAGAVLNAPESPAPLPAHEAPTTILKREPDPEPRREERAARPVVFTSQPTQAVPVCDPVVAPEQTLAADHATMAPPETLQNWAAKSLPKRKSRRKRLATGAAVVLCAVLVGYRLYVPAEAALPLAPRDEALPAGGGRALASGTASPAGVMAGAQALAGIVVNAVVPELETVDASKQRIVLVTKMSAPAEHVPSHTHDAPELSTISGETPALVAPGKSAGLLPATGIAPPPPPEPAPEPPQRVTATVTPARLLTSVQPVYPHVARQAQIQGSVVIEIGIDDAGNVTAMKVLSGSQALRVAAMDAVAKWKYQPAMLNEKPVASTSVVTLQFHLW